MGEAELQSYQEAALHRGSQTLFQLTAGDLMTGDVIVVRENETVREVIRRFRNAGIGGAPVIDASGDIIGLVAAVDILAAEQGPMRSFLDLPIGVLADRRPAKVKVDAPVSRVARRMVRSGAQRALVYEDGAVVGIISATDLVAAIASLDPLAAEQPRTPSRDRLDINVHLARRTALEGDREGFVRALQPARKRLAALIHYELDAYRSAGRLDGAGPEPLEVADEAIHQVFKEVDRTDTDGVHLSRLLYLEALARLNLRLRAEGVLLGGRAEEADSDLDRTAPWAGVDLMDEVAFLLQQDPREEDNGEALRNMQRHSVLEDHAAMQRGELREQILGDLGLLPEEQRSTFMLHVMEGMTMEEIADLTNVSAARVLSNIAEALHRLARRVRPDQE